MEGNVAAAADGVPGIAIDGGDAIVEVSLGVVVVAAIFVGHKEEKWVPSIRSVRQTWR